MTLIGDGLDRSDASHPQKLWNVFLCKLMAHQGKGVGLRGFVMEVITIDLKKYNLSKALTQDRSK